MRKLGTIQKIEWIRDIPDADKICTYGVLGWEIVDQKGKYKVNDLVCYIEIDSILPEVNKFEFMRKYKFRVKTIKLRGQVSQGLIISLEDTKDLAIQLNLKDYKARCYDDYLSWTIGKDITDWLLITKYLSPSEQTELQQQEERIKLEKNKLKKFLMRYSWFRRFFLSRKQKSGFPYWVEKTDEPRCISGDSILNTDKGDFTIKEICESKEPFKVKSYNIDTNTIEYKEIIDKSIKSNNNDWYEIELEDSTKLILTSEHPVYLPKLNCYRQVKDLKSDDLVLLDK